MYHEIIPVDHQSIFSDTIHGVPSPTIPHTHPYPTRFHGPIYTTPRFMLPYREQSWQTPSDYIFPSTFVGPMHGLGEAPALFGTASGSVLLDTLLGAGLGYAVAKNDSERLLWAGAGAAAGLLAGTLGLLGVVGAAIYVRR